MCRILIGILSGFLFATARCNAANPSLEGYGHVISEIHTRYGTSGIIFTSFDQLTLIHKICRSFSNNKISNVVFNFDQLDGRISFYQKKIHRPMIVVFIGGMQGWNEFVNLTRKLPMSYPIWVVIVTSSDDKICEKCRNPVGNEFHLKYDTELIVLCCDHRKVEEWWSQNGYTTKVSPVSQLVDGQMQWVNNDSLFYRRYRVMNQTLRVATVADPIFFSEVNGTFRGFFGEILSELKRTINFTMPELIRMKSYGRLDGKNKWSGLMRKLWKREADLGVAALTITNQRLDVVDFTLPLITAKTKLIFRRQDDAGVKWFAYFQSFDTVTWATIFGIIITTPILLTLIRLAYGQGTISTLIVDNFLDVWSIFCQQGLCEFPHETALRIAIVSIYLTAIVVSAAYSASLISNLTTSVMNLPFKSMEEFADQQEWKLIVMKDSADYDLYAESHDPVLKKMFKLMRPQHLLPSTVHQAFQQVCERKVVFYVTDAIKQGQKINMSCDLVYIDTGRIESLAMTLPRGSEFTRLINYHVQRFRDNGILNRLQQKYTIKLDPPKKDHDEVSLSGVASIFIIVTIGIFLSLLILALELIYIYYRKSFKELHSRKEFKKVKNFENNLLDYYESETSTSRISSRVY